jgi:hypothetical protein
MKNLVGASVGVAYGLASPLAFMYELAKDNNLKTILDKTVEITSIPGLGSALGPMYSFDIQFNSQTTTGELALVLGINAALWTAAGYGIQKGLEWVRGKSKIEEKLS